MSDSLSQPYSAPYFIKYNPALKTEFGSQNAVLLFDRLEYWFSKSKNQFYKFIEPCDHPCYRDGDSWSEELGFSKLVFRNAFDKIGTRYISKTAFEKEGDPFKGKLFASYRDRQSKKTIFVRNNSLLNIFYERMKVIASKAATAIQKTFNSAKTGKSKLIPNPPSRREGYRSSYAGATKDKQRNTSFKKMGSVILGSNPNSTNISTNSSVKSQEMKNIWNEEIGSRGLITLTPETSLKISNALETSFQGSLANWREHCVKIASSKFLMGEKEGTNYEIRILVALTAKFKEQLDEGRFELKTRTTNNDQKIKGLESKVKQIAISKELVDNQLVRLEDDQRSLEKRLISDKEKSLTPAEVDQYKSQYEEEMVDSTCSEGQFFREQGWDGKMVKLMFDLHLRKQISNLLSKDDLVLPEAQEKQCNLQESRGQLQELYEMGIKALRELRINGLKPSIR